MSEQKHEKRMKKWHIWRLDAFIYVQVTRWEGDESESFTIEASVGDFKNRPSLFLQNQTMQYPNTWRNFDLGIFLSFRGNKTNSWSASIQYRVKIAQSYDKHYRTQTLAVEPN